MSQLKNDSEPITFDQLVKIAEASLHKKKLPSIYAKRLKFEISEIHAQGANRYWTDIVNDNKTFDNNKNGLLLPWLLGRLTGNADKDPIDGIDHITLSTNYKAVKKYIDEYNKLPPDIRQDDDKPDIDIDCLPEARDEIKEYAAGRYGRGKVASVGTWSTYLFKQAVQDVAGATSLSKERAIALTRELPDDVNELKDGGFSKCKDCGHVHRNVKCSKCGGVDTENPTLDKLIEEHKEIKDYIDEAMEHEEVIELAARLVGKVRTMGKHAGAIIIADRDLLGNIPMAYDQKNDQWSSMWTEGRSTQLSKFGYNKWDMLGLKNLKYIYECCKMIEKNHGISFGDRMEGWYEHLDPEKDQAGIYWTYKNGKKKTHKIDINDPEALRLANELKTDAVFQFDTDLAKRILSNGVKSFWDLMIFNAMGHPGPMGMIPEYVLRRDDELESWRQLEHNVIADILGVTKGVIVWQEQLQSLWQNIAGFTAPEAQSARKAVAKKWRDKLKPIRQKWIDGAKRIIGESSAIEWWDERMETFGRYAFNKSHNVAYCYIAYQCLWLKAYYPEEWWAAVMSYCHPDRLIRYMNSARGDKVKFGAIDIGRMTTNFTAHNKKITLGLISLKKIGQSLCEQFTDEHAPADTRFEYSSIDDFVERKGKQKTLLERLIKLGSFQHIHPNVRATWKYYLYKYGSGKDITQLRREIRAALLEEQDWNEETIKQEIDRQVKEYKTMYPNRNKIPPKILNWKPKPIDGPNEVMALFPEDYEFSQILEFEKEYLGYYWHSPADLYKTSGRATIEMAKRTGVLQGVITELYYGTTKNDKAFCKLFINDGECQCLLMLWDSDLMIQPKSLLKVDVGVEADVRFDEKRNNFTLQRNTRLKKLWTKKGWEKENADEFN